MRTNKKMINRWLSLIFTLVFGGQTLAATTLDVNAIGISNCQNNEPVYMMLLTMNDLNVSKYRVERQKLGETKKRILAEVSYAEMQRAGFQYVDLVGLEKHGRYRYLVSAIAADGQIRETASVYGVVENIRYKGDLQQFIPVFSRNNATFTLGPKADPENETLEYRLYTRLPGGGGEKVLKVWLPQSDHEQVIVNFPETCEWKLSCIETDATIPDKSEVVLVNWSLFASKY